MAGLKRSIYFYCRQDAVLSAASGCLCGQKDKRLDADSVKNLLKSRYRNSLVFRFLVTADDLFTNAEPAGKFGLRDSLRNPIFATNGAI